mgnify:CR=1 FL=1
MSISWVDWFFSQPFSQFFIRIDDDYLNNIENYYGIRQKVSFFNISLTIIRGQYIPEDSIPKTWPEHINDYALTLYGMLHARFLSTNKGLELMYQKYQKSFFEACPRTFCHNILCIPYGNSNDFGNSTVKMFCPNCNDIYHVKNEECYFIDGACFGNSWVHLFLQKYPEIVPKKMPEKYVPRLFGYQLYNNETNEELE